MPRHSGPRMPHITVEHQDGATADNIIAVVFVVSNTAICLRR